MTKFGSRQLALQALQAVIAGTYTDRALDRVLNNEKIKPVERGLTCELVYGVVRRQRSLDTLIDRFAARRASQQPPKLRLILQLGLYQLRYLDQIPASAAVNTSVQLAKENGLAGLSGVVNGILRQYLRCSENEDPLVLPNHTISALGVAYSFPDWIVELFNQQFKSETPALLDWFNQPPHLDLRVNTLLTDVATVQSSLEQAGITTQTIPELPQALRIVAGAGAIANLPGYNGGWWVVQDGSAQLAAHLLDPQPGETVVDGCAAPGGKTTHIAELMQDRGKIWAVDLYQSRLKQIQQNIRRLQLNSIQLCLGDSRNLPQFNGVADRVLLDVPCSGLGTLHRRPDIRWQQSPTKIQQLVELQKQLLVAAAQWVKPGGSLVYSTCTLNPAENEAVVQWFLATRPEWQIQSSDRFQRFFDYASSGLKIYPHLHDLDGFFLVKLSKLN